ncbi:MAG: CAP domain-containing protein, partial [Caldilineaceae bacterium]|nr:CAP domain-containing protein [Caldilineaceae bacterium]
RINYYRAMAGVPADITLLADYNQQAQAAALMMSVNQRSSHDPTVDWTCYTIAGDTAAQNSNLYLGVFGTAAIDGYIRDPGDNNDAVGHRRWLLFPQTRFMGSGDLPHTNTYQGANALWVFDDHAADPRPPTREEFVAGPPPGCVP